MSAGRNSLIYIAFSILQKAISFVLLPVLTYVLSKDSMGKITLLTALVPILSLFCGLVLYGAGTAYTYKYKDEAKIKQLWGNISLFTNVFGVVFIFVMLFVYDLIKDQVFEGLEYYDFLIILAVVFFGSVYNQYQTYLQARQQVSLFTRNALLYTVINVSLVLFNVVILHLGYRGYFYAMLITSGIFYFYTMYHGWRNFNFKFNKQIIKDCLLYALPLLPHLTFMISLGYMDRIFVNKYMGLDEVGVYGVACQFAIVFGLVISGFNQSYSPFSFENIEKKNYRVITEFCYKMLVVFSVLVIIISAFSKGILYVVVNNRFIDGWVVLPIFAIASLFQLGYIFFVNNVFYHKPGLVNIVTITSGCLNLVLNIYLTQYFGIVGASSCTLLSYLASMIIVYNISARLEDMGFKIYNVMFYYVVVIIFALVTYFINGSNLTIIKITILNIMFCLIVCFVLVKILAPRLLGVNLKLSDIKFK